MEMPEEGRNQMSDITLRFDGLVLAGSFVMGASIFLLVAFFAAVVSTAKTENRERLMLVARTASLFGLLNLVALGLVVAYMAYIGPPITGPDRIDWLTFPSLFLFIVGCVIVARRKPA